MACGTAVVASRQATYSLEACPGTHLLAADDANAFAQEVLALLSDTARLNKITQAGRDYVEQHHSWSVIAAQLETIYRSLLAEPNLPVAQHPRAEKIDSPEMIVQL
jgi:glycosyltransferase involved in cell wall biosynthesis